MAIRKGVVVTRQLKGHRPVVAAVICEPATHDRDSIEGWLKAVAQDRIDDMKKLFVEFEEAEFYVDIVEIDTEPRVY